ncbi:MAG: hypothetical protein Q8M71_07275 [Thermodesulfovibrionales bacterium]|nr:hypothetical protein [Thermodesulfovibrionales bacterium]
MRLSLLLKPRILSLKNSLNTRIVMRRLPFVAIGAGFWILFYIGTYKVLAYVRGIEFLGEMLSRKLFSMTFFSLLGFLILSNIITAISSFYLSRDIPFFLSKPIEMRDILRLKSFETILNSSWMVMSFIPPVFIAYGVSYNASLNYYISVFAAFMMFIFITAGLGIIIAHILTRLFPAKRSRDVLLGLGIILFLVLYFILKSVVPHDISKPEDFINSIMTFKTDSFLLPSYWITEAILPMLKNEKADIFYLLILFSNSTFFLLLSAIIGNKLYRGNIERIQPSGKSAGKFLRSFYPERNMALIYKDTKIFFRDTGQWSQIFIIGALIMVYIYNFKSIPMDAIAGLSPFIRELMVLVNMVLAGIVLSAVAARFLYTSVSLEGEAFWVIRTAPVEMAKFLWSKLLYACIPVTLLMVFLVFVTNLAMGVKGILLSVSIATTLMLCISVSGLGTGFGAIYPKFKYENIASVSMSLGGMAFMLIAFSVVIVTLSLEAWIFYLHRIKLISGFSWQSTLCVVLILLINTAAFYLPMRIGEKKLQENAGII